MKEKCTVKEAHDQIAMRRRRRAAIREVCELSPDPVKFIERWVHDEGHNLQSSAYRDLIIVHRELLNEKIRKEYNRNPPGYAVGDDGVLQRNPDPARDAGEDRTSRAQLRHDLDKEKQISASHLQAYNNARTNLVSLENIVRRVTAGEDADPTCVYSYVAEKLFQCTSRYRKTIEELRERINTQESTIRAKNEELGCQAKHIVEFRERITNQANTIREQANENLFLRGQSGALQSELDAVRARNVTQAHTIREKQAQVLTLTNLLDDARGQLKNEPAPAAPQMTSTAEDYITADGVIVCNVNGTGFALWPDGTLRQEFTEKYQHSVWRTVRDCPSRAVYSAFSGFKAWANFKGEVLNYGV